MKIKKLENLIKKSKSVAIVEDGGAFWLGNERAMYPTYFEHIDFDMLMTIFDIDAEKRESITEITSELIARADTSDDCAGEILLKRFPLRVVWEKPLIGLYVGADSDEIFYIDERLLEPVRDAKEGIELYLRRDRIGGSYIAVKNGMLLVGIIAPEETDRMLADQLSMLCKLTTATVNKYSSADSQERLYG